MQDIIEVNQIVNPHSLPIGLKLIIPRSQEEARELQPTPTPTPMPLRTDHVGLHRTPAGSLWCMGEVINERAEALDLVRLEVVLYNAGGEVLDRAAAFVASDVVPGNGVAPFAILLPNAPAAGYAGYEIRVLSAIPIGEWGHRHRELTVEALQGEMQEREGTLAVQGTVRNRGQADAEQVRITFTAYGEDDVVVGVRQTSLSRLASGKKRQISLSMVPAAPALRVDAVAWGMKALD
jgi:hypothetical protein